MQSKLIFCAAIIVATSALLSLPLSGKTLLVANKISKSVSFTSDAKLKEVSSLSIGQTDEDTPHEVAVSPNGKWALVSHL